jgi:tetrahydromethanopterin S-methyltransferase subunit G
VAGQPDLWTVIQQRIDQLEAKIDQIKGVAGPPGEKGEKGDKGDTGAAATTTAEKTDLSGVESKLDKIAEKLQPATVDLTAILARLEKLENTKPAAVDTSSIPPIRIQTLNIDGTVHQDVQARLGDLIKLEPIPVKTEAK